MRGIEDPKTKLPELKTDGRMHVSLFGSYFEQNKVIIPNNNNVINIYCVYELRQVNIPLSIEFTILNVLFGAMEITKNANTSKYKYKGYGICFDKGSSFSEGSINNGRNVLIFGVHESSFLHSNNKANNIYVMHKDFVQGINGTTLYAEKVYSQNFTQPNKKFVLSLHYNDDNSYLFVNGSQENALECVSVIYQKCMPRSKILEVNEGVGKALFYPCNVLVNKCSGSCNTFDNPMSKRVNMQVYNFLMMLNETRNVLWHESCKCICKLNSSVWNNKQIWNGDTCRCDCNEDFAGIINCTKGHIWNPSTCECQCDMWCKPGQYLDHKNCICKNKLIGRVIEELLALLMKL